jgi:hypothetical protein
VQAALPKEIEDLKSKPWPWSAFLFCYHMFGELIPMNMVFLFQIVTNVKRLRVKRMIQESCDKEDEAKLCKLKVPRSEENKSGEEGTPSTCDEVNTYYDENEVDCNNNNAFDKFIEKRRRLAAGTGGQMGESQSEVESEYRVVGSKKKRQREEEAIKTGFGTGTIVEYQRNPSYSQQSFANVEDGKEEGLNLA